MTHRKSFLALLALALTATVCLLALCPVTSAAAQSAKANKDDNFKRQTTSAGSQDDVALIKDDVASSISKATARILAGPFRGPGGVPGAHDHPINERATGLLYPTFPSTNTKMLRNYAYKQRYSSVRPFRKYDWREYGILSPVVDQSTCGACYAYAVVHAIEALFAISSRGSTEMVRVKLAELQAAICGKPKTGALGGCSGGWINDVYQYASDNGILPQDKWATVSGLMGAPQRDAQCPVEAVGNAITEQLGQLAKSLSTHDTNRTNDEVANNYLARIQNWESVPPSEYSIAQVVSNQPVVAIVHAAPDWKTYNGSTVYNGNCSSLAEDANHAVLIVGYTETTFIVKNSWGNSWGDSGYIHIRRGPGRSNACGILNYVTYPVLNALPASKRNEMMREGTCASYGKVSADMKNLTVMDLVRNLTSVLELKKQNATAEDQELIGEINTLQLALTYDEFVRVNPHIPPDSEAVLEPQTIYYIPPCTSNLPRTPVPQVECGIDYPIDVVEASDGTKSVRNLFSDGVQGRRLLLQRTEKKRRQLYEQLVQRRLLLVTASSCSQRKSTPATDTCSAIAKLYHVNWATFSSMNVGICSARNTVIPSGTMVCTSLAASSPATSSPPLPSPTTIVDGQLGLLFDSSVLTASEIWAPGTSDKVKKVSLDCGSGFVTAVTSRNRGNGQLSDMAVACSTGGPLLSVSGLNFPASTEANCEGGFNTVQVLEGASASSGGGFRLRCGSGAWTAQGHANVNQAASRRFTVYTCPYNSLLSALAISYVNTSEGHHRRSLTIQATCSRWWPVAGTTSTGTETCGSIARDFLGGNLHYLNDVNHGVCPTASTVVPRGSRLCIACPASITSAGVAGSSNIGSSSGSCGGIVSTKPPLPPTRPPPLSPFSLPPRPPPPPSPALNSNDVGIIVTQVRFNCTTFPAPPPPQSPPLPLPRTLYNLGEERQVMDAMEYYLTTDGAHVLMALAYATPTDNQTWAFVPIGSPDAKRYLVVLKPTPNYLQPRCARFVDVNAADNVVGDVAICDPSDERQRLEVRTPPELEVVQQTPVPRGKVHIKFSGIQDTLEYRLQVPYDLYVTAQVQPTSHEEQLLLDYEFEDDFHGTVAFEASCPGNSYITGISGTAWFGLPELPACVWSALLQHTDGPGLLAPMLQPGSDIFQTLDFTCSDGTVLRTGREDSSASNDVRFPLYGNDLTSFNWSEPSCPGGYDMVRADTCDGCDNYRFRTYFRCQSTKHWTAFANGLLQDGQLARNMTTASPDAAFAQAIQQSCGSNDTTLQTYELPSPSQLTKLKAQPLATNADVVAGVFGRRGNMGDKDKYIERILSTWRQVDVKASYSRQWSPSYVSIYKLEGTVCRKKAGNVAPTSISPINANDTIGSDNTPAGMKYIGTLSAQGTSSAATGRALLSCGTNAFSTGVFSISSKLHITKLGIRCSDGTSSSIGDQNQFDELGDNSQSSSLMEYPCPDGFESVQIRPEISSDGKSNGTMGLGSFAFGCGLHVPASMGTALDAWAKLGNPPLVILNNTDVMTPSEAAFIPGNVSSCTYSRDGANTGISALLVEYLSTTKIVNGDGTDAGRRRQLTISASCPKWWPPSANFTVRGNETCGYIARVFLNGNLVYLNSINAGKCPTPTTIIARGTRLCIQPAASVGAAIAGSSVTSNGMVSTSLASKVAAITKKTLVNYYIQKVHVYCGPRPAVLDRSFLDIANRFGITLSDLMQANNGTAGRPRINVTQPLSDYAGQEIKIPQVCGTPTVAPPVTTLAATCSRYWPTANSTNNGDKTCRDVAQSHLNGNLRYLNLINNNMCPNANTPIGKNIKLCIAEPGGVLSTAINVYSAFNSAVASYQGSAGHRRRLLAHEHYQIKWPHSRRHLGANETAQGRVNGMMNTTCFSYRWAADGESCDEIALQHRLTLTTLMLLNSDLSCATLQAGALLCVQGAITTMGTIFGMAAPYDVSQILGSSDPASTAGRPPSRGIP